MLDGALALAVPTKFGQSLTVQPWEDHQELNWTSFDHLGDVWLHTQISRHHTFSSIKNSDASLSLQLIAILNAIRKLNPKFLLKDEGFAVKTHLDFPRHWGLGTSSTLINNLSQWAKVDPYVLLEATFGGSGYDIACATHNTPITYQLEQKNRTIIERHFDPDFKDQLYFVYLNKKQNSRHGIATYRNQETKSELAFSEISAITNDMLSCTSLETFQFLMQSHESIISQIINQTPVKTALFKDFDGSIKSLGAWGGDFILVASQEHPGVYFENKAYHTIIPYADMVL